MRKVVERLADAGQFHFPEQSAGVNIDGAHHVHAFDDRAAVNDLGLGSVAVSGQHTVIRRSAEPEDAERSLHDGVKRDAGVGRVGVFIGPVPSAGNAAATGKFHE